MLFLFSGVALAHDYAIITLGPSVDWCDQLHAQAAPADVVQLLPGDYPGGCTLSLGGIEELNEPLLVTTLDGGVRIGADSQGGSLRITGVRTRLLGLQLDGTLEIDVDRAIIDSCDVPTLDVDPDVSRVTFLWSTLPDLALDVDDTVIRGNRIASLDVQSTTGLVADNVILGDASSTLAFERNLVLGSTSVVGVAYANVLAGAVQVDGRLVHNTVLDQASATFAANNLTLVADLPADQGNLMCPDCIGSVDTLDIRPRDEAMAAVTIDTEGPRYDYCGVALEPRVGALSANVQPLRAWSAFDRDRDGCSPSLGVPPPPLPPPTPPPEETPESPELPEPEASGCMTTTVSSGWWLWGRR